MVFRTLEDLTNGFFKLSCPTESIPMVVERRSGEGARDRHDGSSPAVIASRRTVPLFGVY